MLLVLFLVGLLVVRTSSLFNNCSETPDGTLRNMTVINGLQATFQCDRHPLTLRRSWVVNGTLYNQIPDTLVRYIDRIRPNATTDHLIIVGNIHTNGTTVGCYTYLQNDTSLCSPEVTLTVQELKNVTKLTVARAPTSSHRHLGIEISWEIPQNLMNLTVTVTYCIEIKKKGRQEQLLHRACNITERSYEYFYDADLDPNPCNDINITVTPHIGLTEDYPGMRSIEKRAYFYAKREDTSIDTANVTKCVNVTRKSGSEIEVFQFEFQLPNPRPVCMMIINATFDSDSRQDEADSEYSLIDTGVTEVGFTNRINISSDQNELPLDNIFFVTIQLIYDYAEMNTSVTTLHANLSTFNTQNLRAINGTITVIYANGTNALGSLLVFVNVSQPGSFKFKLKPVERQNFTAIHNLSMTEHFNTVMAFDIGSNGILKEQPTVKPAVEFSGDLSGTINYYLDEDLMSTSPLTEKITITPSTSGDSVTSITVECNIISETFRGCLTHILNMTNLHEIRPYRMDFTSNPNKRDTYPISPGKYHVTVFLWASNDSGLLHSPSKSQVVTVSRSKGRKSSHQTMTMLLMVAMVNTYSTFMIEC